MSDPVILPSGNVVDMSTLTKHEAVQLELGRQLFDPFTGTVLRYCQVRKHATLRRDIERFLSGDHHQKDDTSHDQLESWLEKNLQNNNCKINFSTFFYIFLLDLDIFFLLRSQFEDFTYFSFFPSSYVIKYSMLKARMVEDGVRVVGWHTVHLCWLCRVSSPRPKNHPVSCSSTPSLSFSLSAVRLSNSLLYLLKSMHTVP